MLYLRQKYCFNKEICCFFKGQTLHDVMLINDDTYTHIHWQQMVSNINFTKKY